MAQAVFKTTPSTLRDVPFAIQVADWVSSGGIYIAVFATAYVTATSKEIVNYDESFRQYAKADVLAAKTAGGGSVTFTTSIVPTGPIAGNMLVFDPEDGKVAVVMEETVVPITNGGTGANTLASAKQAFGVTVLENHVEYIDTSTVISDLDDIPLNSQGRITLAASVSPTGAQTSFDFHCFGNSAYRALHIVGTYSRTEYLNTRHNSATWKGWFSATQKIETCATFEKYTFTQSAPATIPNNNGHGAFVSFGSNNETHLGLWYIYFPSSSSAAIATISSSDRCSLAVSGGNIVATYTGTSATSWVTVTWIS